VCCQKDNWSHLWSRADFRGETANPRGPGRAISRPAPRLSVEAKEPPESGQWTPQRSRRRRWSVAHPEEQNRSPPAVQAQDRLQGSLALAQQLLVGSLPLQAFRGPKILQQVQRPRHRLKAQPFGRRGQPEPL